MIYLASNGMCFDSFAHGVCDGPYGVLTFNPQEVQRGYRLSQRGLYPSWQEYVARLIEYRYRKANL